MRAMKISAPRTLAFQRSLLPFGIVWTRASTPKECLSSLTTHTYESKQMDIAPFFYHVLKINRRDDSRHLLGTTFPITPNGGFITCRHVLTSHITDQEFIAIFDNERGKLVPVDLSTCIMPANPEHDLAFIPDALKRPKPEFFPFLTPSHIKIGENVYSYGYFLSSSSEPEAADSTSLNQGYFKGNIVNFSNSPKTPGSVAVSLSYAVVEGLSGSPVLTYHNGPKVVGMCYGNVQSRVVASEVLEYRDKTMEYKETVNRIVEFGRAHLNTAIVRHLQQNGVEGFIESSGSLNLPSL